ncbi:MAG TPA: CRISPR-associated RAMP protein Csx10 [Cyanobacteria bacterium UBA11149]|nr:CRISPR-associated RAMP protein Csx10 [Cyanobacteria bacterium UBA11367]HBE60806.1 CRISPR-associated RAMP protein Csx10 [Cyanobacteria bacterium UBA11366]HBK66407.1 CRISPR-associated RAMP protein Csx10 [Cyanobacteria bacterium UBA11166]HBR73660.1 CRISPR-associated RAMP protein Csx10 [Cyanobacteria bacterium UBA11159]HBS72211.1 CRISPR-associated RAMP protein Csx10 [Cyanobacteria bacterium UBA11153]HBW90283.1 CRISPR-associated RAMP protein Csx10 [Cyanobacteria bacterium UBA11149]HCA98185.1 CR
MKRIQLEIKALSPLAIGRQKPGGSVSEAEDYIPGSVIRGAIASQILRLSGHQSSNLAENGGDFQTLFLSDTPAIFQNAYPVKPDMTRRIDGIWVLPTTALSSKTKEGFKIENGNGVFDTLIDRFCAEGYGHLYDPICPNDGGRVEAYTGFYCKVGGNYYSHSVSKRLLTRVGINRRRATAEEQILYSIEVINESQHHNQKPIRYYGSVIVPDSLVNSFCEFINNRREDFRLGGSTSRGLGKVEITAKIIESKPQIKTRIEQFNTKLKERWRQWQVFGNPNNQLSSDRTYFTIDLQSDAILTEQWRRTTVISSEMLCHFAGVTDPSLQLHAAYSSYDYRSGWNTAWGLMKDVELITNKAAVYLFSTTQPNTWFTIVEDLEIRGVGERTCEGFGQIQICNEFHTVFREDAV